jgi:hypothetical protein
MVVIMKVVNLCMDFWEFLQKEDPISVKLHSFVEW